MGDEQPIPYVLVHVDAVHRLNGNGFNIQT